MTDDLDKLGEACRDLGYEIAKTLGVLSLIKRLGMTPKPWVRERQIRDLHRNR